MYKTLIVCFHKKAWLTKLNKCSLHAIFLIVQLFNFTYFLFNKFCRFNLTHCLRYFLDRQCMTTWGVVAHWTTKLQRCLLNNFEKKIVDQNPHQSGKYSRLCLVSIVLPFSNVSFRLIHYLEQSQEQTIGCNLLTSFSCLFVIAAFFRTRYNSELQIPYTAVLWRCSRHDGRRMYLSVAALPLLLCVYSIT